MVPVKHYSEGLRPSDSLTRSLAGPRDPHFARVARFAVLARVLFAPICLVVAPVDLGARTRLAVRRWDARVLRSGRSVSTWEGAD